MTQSLSDEARALVARATALDDNLASELDRLLTKYAAIEKAFDEIIEDARLDELARFDAVRDGSVRRIGRGN